MAERDPIVEFEHQAKIAQGFGDSHVQIPTADLVAVSAELARLRAQLAEANEEARDNKIHAALLRSKGLEVTP